ncbi:hypothetical protein, partial [Mesorhizobium sp. B2-4-13]|uniref:hypothetical protein n=1 Tax=Mesorhizobium sp. B2-4-13 TaxID=2589936 RepID=UPI001AEF3247
GFLAAVAPFEANSPGAGVACRLRAAIVIGRILRDLFTIVVPLQIFDNTLFYALFHDSALLR